MIYLRLAAIILLVPASFGNANIYGDSVEKLTISSGKFATDLYSQIVADPKVTNVVFSPVGISAALAMTKLGSKFNSSAQIGQALYLDDIEAGLINSAFGELNGLLFDKPRTNITLKGANGAFISKKAKVLKDYKNALSVFSAAIEELDFTDTESSVKFINNWISENTGGLISDMLTDDAVDATTSLILASTIYFSGDWHSAFVPSLIEDRAFFVSHYKIVKTPFMYQKGKFKFAYIDSLTLQILEMPYVNQEISMVIMLPDNFDLATVEKNLNYENLTNWLSGLKYNTVDITFPKFKLEENLNLQKPLEGLGIKDIFQQNKADLSGISGDKSLFVDEIMHRGVLEVTETGSKAAAATTVRIVARSIDLSVRFMADHPFVWLIRHIKTGRILFLGRLTRPEGVEMAHDEL